MARTSTALSAKPHAPKSAGRSVVRVAPTQAEASQRLSKRGSFWAKLNPEQKARALSVLPEVAGKRK
jgi:hypothetical protein